jgi:hypothetical protein
VQHKFWLFIGGTSATSRRWDVLPGWINLQVVMLPSIETGEFIVTQLIYPTSQVLVDIFMAVEVVAGCLASHVRRMDNVRISGTSPLGSLKTFCMLGELF